MSITEWQPIGPWADRWDWIVFRYLSGRLLDKSQTIPVYEW